MIINNMLDLVYTLLTASFSWLNLPAMPQQIIDAGNYLLNLVSFTVGLLKYIYGADLFNVILTVVVALLLFDQAYWLVMYILRKIPFINVK